MLPAPAHHRIRVASILSLMFLGLLMSQLSAADLAPTIVKPAAASPALVSGTTTTLSVTGSDDAGASTLVYAWSASGPSPVSFSASGTPAAASVKATFTAPGAYVCTATVTDTAGQSVTSVVTVEVVPTMVWLSISPTSAVLPPGTAKRFIGAATNQFGTVMADAPLSWGATSASGADGVDQSGLFTTGATPGAASVTVRCGRRTATAVIRVNAAPTIALAPISTPFAGITLPVAATGADADDADSTLRYTWTAIAPPGVKAVSFTPPWTSPSAMSVARFSAAGAYLLTVTVRDPAGLSASASQVVTVQAVQTSVEVRPNAAATVVNPGSTRAFTATVKDQFGAAILGIPVTWTVAPAAAGTITPTGVLTGATPGLATIMATTGLVAGSAPVRVNAAPTLLLPVFEPVTGTSAALTVTAMDPDDAATTLRYIWSAKGPKSVVFSPNGTAASSSTTATFTAAGRYTLTVVAKDPAGLSGSTSRTLVVQPFGEHVDDPRVAAPVLTPASATFLSDPQTVSASSATAGTVLRYTTDGTDPTASSPTLPVPLSLSATTHLAVRAFLGTTASTVTRGDYVFQVQPVMASPAAGGYLSPQVVTLSTATSSAEIAYTRDGSDPLTSATAVRSVAPASVTVAASAVLTAVATRTGWTPSATVTRPYSIIRSPTITAEPTATPAAIATTSTALTVSASDPQGLPLSYLWSGDPSVAFSTATAATTTATFSGPGSYPLQVQVSNAAGLSVTSTVTVTVTSIPATVAMTASTATLIAGHTTAFTAQVSDQFGLDLAQPVVWSASGAGTIDAGGLFTAGSSAGTATVTARVGTLQAQATVTVLRELVITPASGTHAVPATVQVTCAMPGASVRYTIDGREPGEADPLWPEEGLPIDAPMSLLLRVRATALGMQPSIAEASYDFVAGQDAGAPKVSWSTPSLQVVASEGTVVCELVLDRPATAAGSIALIASGDAEAGVDVEDIPVSVAVAVGAQRIPVLLQLPAGAATGGACSLILALAQPGDADGYRLGSPSQLDLRIVSATEQAPTLGAPTILPGNGAFVAPHDATAVASPAEAVVWFTITADGSEPAAPIAAAEGCQRWNGPLDLRPGLWRVRAVSAWPDGTGGWTQGPERTATWRLIGDHVPRQHTRTHSSHVSPASIVATLPGGVAVRASLVARVDGRVFATAPAMLTGDGQVIGDIPIQPMGTDGTPTEVLVRGIDASGRAIEARVLVSWMISDLMQPDDQIIRAGDMLLLSAGGAGYSRANGAVPFLLKTGVGDAIYTVAGGGTVMAAYPDPGIYTASLSDVDGTLVCSRRIVVLAAAFTDPPGPVLAHTGVSRPMAAHLTAEAEGRLNLDVLGGTGHLPTGSGDISIPVTVDPFEAKGPYGPWKRSYPIAVLKTQSGLVVAAREITPFQFVAEPVAVQTASTSDAERFQPGSDDQWVQEGPFRSQSWSSSALHRIDLVPAIDARLFTHVAEINDDGTKRVVAGSTTGDKGGDASGGDVLFTDSTAFVQSFPTDGKRISSVTPRQMLVRFAGRAGDIEVLRSFPAARVDGLELLGSYTASYALSDFPRLDGGISWWDWAWSPSATVHVTVTPAGFDDNLLRSRTSWSQPFISEWRQQSAESANCRLTYRPVDSHTGLVASYRASSTFWHPYDYGLYGQAYFELRADYDAHSLG